MPSDKPSELKKRLAAAGFEIFRVQGSRICLADRVRENLIMDSGVCAVAARRPTVRFTVKAQGSHFPKEKEDELFQRARRLAEPGRARGYTEVETAVVPVNDPGGGKDTLDTWYEISFEKTVSSDELFDELRFALGLEKTAGTG